MASEVEYVVLERVLLALARKEDEEGPEQFVEHSGGNITHWREVSRVTAARKAVVLRDHTPERGVFLAIPASDFDSAVEVGTEQVPKRTVRPLKERPKRQRKKKTEPASA